MSEAVWTLPEIAEITGAQYRTLHGWVQAGLLVPSLKTSRGSGNSNLFSNDDLIRAGALVALRPYLTLDGLRALFGDETDA